MTPLTSDECHKLATVWHICVYILCAVLWRNEWIITLGSWTTDSMRWSDGWKSRFLITPPPFDVPVRGSPSTSLLGGPRQNTDITSGMRKLEWCSYLVVKNFEDIFIHFDRIHERDRQTDRQTDSGGFSQNILGDRPPSAEWGGNN